MTPEQAAAYVHAQSVCAQAEIAGMQADNQQRLLLGHSIAHDAAAFMAVPDRFGIGCNTIAELFRDANSCRYEINRG